MEWWSNGSDITPSLQRSITPFSDYHTHPQGHRVRPYTQQFLQPWIESARARGLTDIASPITIGITPHRLRRNR